MECSNRGQDGAEPRVTTQALENPAGTPRFIPTTPHRSSCCSRTPSPSALLGPAPLRGSGWGSGQGKQQGEAGLSPVATAPCRGGRFRVREVVPGEGEALHAPALPTLPLPDLLARLGACGALPLAPRRVFTLFHAG